jgi:RNA polymerase sigma-70 factor, ECF subfamily
MIDNSDDAILLLVQTPSTLERGFRIFMDTYQNKIYWIIRKMVSSHEDTDDIIQNTFVKAYKGITKFEKRSSLFTWLYRIALNETYTFQKLKNKNATVDIDLQVFDIQEKEHADFDVSDAETKLKHAIELLPEKQKQVFNMRYFDEISYREMSEMLATSEGALKASYHIALKKIESYLLN